MGKEECKRKKKSEYKTRCNSEQKGNHFLKVRPKETFIPNILSLVLNIFLLSYTLHY
jgi:hypothetical protein